MTAIIFSFHSCFTQQVLAVYVASERVCGKTKHDIHHASLSHDFCLLKILLLMWSRISLSFSVAIAALIADGHLCVQFIHAAAPVCQWINPL